MFAYRFNLHISPNIKLFFKLYARYSTLREPTVTAYWFVSWTKEKTKCYHQVCWLFDVCRFSISDTCFNRLVSTQTVMMSLSSVEPFLLLVFLTTKKHFIIFSAQTSGLLCSILRQQHVKFQSNALRYYQSPVFLMRVSLHNNLK